MIEKAFFPRLSPRVLLAFLLLLLVPRVFKTNPVPELSPQSPLAEKILKIVEAPAVKSALWGIEIRRAADQSVLFALNAEKNFVPASNLKLLTAAAALDQAGPDWRFKTVAFGESSDLQKEPLEAGEWKGNLVLKGGGDPVFSDRVFDPEEERSHPEEKPAALRDLARQLAARGVKRVAGNLIVDNSEFLSEPIGKGWEWDDLGWYYAAPVTPLAVNENSIEARITPGSVEGEPCQFSFTPSFCRPFFGYRVRTTLKEPVSPIQIERLLDREGWILTGEMRVGSAADFEKVAVWDPGRYAGILFRVALAEEGIAISPEQVVRAYELGVEPEKAAAFRPEALMQTLPVRTELAVRQSPPLSEILKFLLKNSNNLYAEMLLRHLGKSIYPVGCVKGGLMAIGKFLEKAGIDSSTAVLQDGSGMAKSNLVSPHLLVQLLAFMKTHPHSQTFFEALPVAGRDGTLKTRMAKSFAKGRIFAKTGTLSTANSLSGYARTNHGEELIFSIMANNHAGRAGEVRRAIDQICELMVELEPAKTK
jgi:D-alanyl-D-alanine carboxypeptidase/D-alanyl-D-alanine-endopeptidase (penicillin-binding protein 4)